MGRSDTIRRMDFDTEWLYHHRARDLVRKRPTDWPTWYCAYLVVLADSWRRGQRVTIESAWPPTGTMPCTVEDARAVLVDVGLLDRTGRVRKDSWDEWVVPTLQRIDATRAAASAAATTRWDRWRADRGLPPVDRTTKAPTVRKGRNATAHATAHATAMPKPSQAKANENGASAPLRAGSAAAPDDLWRDGLPHLTPDLVHQAEQLVGMTFLQAGAKVPTALDQLVERHGQPKVAAALSSVAGAIGQPSWPQLVYGARNALEPIPGGKPQAPPEPAPDPDQAARRERSRLRHMAYLRGDITEAEMDRLRDIDGVP